VIGRHQNIFGDELQGTYTICWPTYFLKGDEARHKVLPSSIRSNSAQIAYHPCEICWKIRVVGHNHVCITIASILGGGLNGFRGLANRSSAVSRITNGVKSAGGMRVRVNFSGFQVHTCGRFDNRCRGGGIDGGFWDSRCIRKMTFGPKAT
jgi:hypothetical protein